MSIFPSWSPPPIEDGQTPERATAVTTWTVVPGTATVPVGGPPVAYPAEVAIDPDHPDLAVFTFDDTRPEGIALPVAVARDLSGWVFRVAWRARTPPASDSSVVFGVCYRCPYRTDGWIAARLGIATAQAGRTAWIESVFTLSVRSFDVPPGTHGVLVVRRDADSPDDDLVGDALVAVVGVEAIL